MKRPETKIPSVSGSGVIISCRSCAGISLNSNSTVKGAQIMIASVASSTLLCDSDIHTNPVECVAKVLRATSRPDIDARARMRTGPAVTPSAIRRAIRWRLRQVDRQSLRSPSAQQRLRRPNCLPRRLSNRLRHKGRDEARASSASSAARRSVRRTTRRLPVARRCRPHCPRAVARVRIARSANCPPAAAATSSHASVARRPREVADAADLRRSSTRLSSLPKTGFRPDETSLGRRSGSGTSRRRPFCFVCFSGVFLPRNCVRAALFLALAQLARCADGARSPRMNTMQQPGGTIYAASSRGIRRGSPTEAASYANVSMSGRATIMVVDDEPDVREVLEEYFVSHGYAVLAAENADAARGLAAAHPIDLALVDINMPGEDGLSLARHLRERYAQIAIVMLTSA